MFYVFIKFIHNAKITTSIYPGNTSSGYRISCLIHLGTFKPMDGRHVCLGTSTWVFDVWSIFIGITHP